MDQGPALARNQIGAGQAFTLGWYPDPEQARTLVRHLCRLCAINLATALPVGVLRFQRGRFTAFLNLTDTVQRVAIEETQA